MDRGARACPQKTPRVHPLCLLERPRHRGDGALDQNAFLEADRDARLALHAGDQLPAFDDLEIVEAEIVARLRE